MAYGLSNSRDRCDDVTWPLKVLWGSTVGYPSDSLASCHLNLVNARRHSTSKQTRKRRDVDCSCSISSIQTTLERNLSCKARSSSDDQSLPPRMFFHLNRIGISRKLPAGRLHAVYIWDTSTFRRRRCFAGAPQLRWYAQQVATTFDITVITLVMTMVMIKLITIST